MLAAFARSPGRLARWICEDNPVRAIDVFVDELALSELGFGGVDPEATGRPSYHPSVLLKLYIYGGILHRPGRDRFKGLAMAVSYTNGGMDLQPFGAEVTGVG